MHHHDGRSISGPTFSRPGRRRPRLWSRRGFAGAGTERDRSAGRTGAADRARPSGWAGPPPGIQRANRPGAPQQEPEEPEELDYQPSPVHPLHRYAAQQPIAPAQEYQEEAPQYAEAEPQPDPARYDDAL